MLSDRKQPGGSNLMGRHQMTVCAIMHFYQKYIASSIFLYLYIDLQIFDPNL
jgi:hypothetical protein